MSLARRTLLALSTNQRLQDWATQSTVVRRSLTRFMPGERLDDALGAARALQASGISAILTHLGESLKKPEDAAAVVRHYCDVLNRVAEAGLDAHISVKPTQLGLEIDPTMCRGHLERIVDEAERLAQFVWLDMERSEHVDATFALLDAAQARTRRIGVAVQAYLRRSSNDIDRLLTARTGGIRLVKGAYLEPSSIAWQDRSEIDAQYFQLGVRLLGAAAAGGPLVHLATHDPRLISKLREHANGSRIPTGAYEYAMLYGIQRGLQHTLASEGQRVRVLIAYGDNWFPWFMRRLAERPANVGLLVRNLAG